MSAQKTGLVITAHPGDFVWRAGGAIALHARRGMRVKILCLSYGERGESQFAWKKAGVQMADVKAQRREEAEAAAALLGAEIDSELERGRELQAGIPAEAELQLPPRDDRNIEKAREKEQKDIALAREIREANDPDGSVAAEYDAEHSGAGASTPSTQVNRREQ